MLRKARALQTAADGMEIHRPNPGHDWRELLKEIGIIVIGVLIALGAEQAVETLHWRHRIHDAVEAMRLELRYDDGPQGFIRVAAENCFAQKLDAIQDAVEAGKDRRGIAAYRPLIRTWDAEAWTAAVASGVGGHVSADQTVDWSKPYPTIPALQAVNSQERDDWISLQPGAARQGACRAARKTPCWRPSSGCAKRTSRWPASPAPRPTGSKSMGWACCPTSKLAFWRG